MVGADSRAVAHDFAVAENFTADFLNLILLLKSFVLALY